MQKSIYTAEYGIFLKLLRDAREKAGITQTDAADKMRTTQSYVSKCERGERRLDIVELKDWCDALGLSFAKFAAEFDKAVSKKR